MPPSPQKARGTHQLSCADEPWQTSQWHQYNETGGGWRGGGLGSRLRADKMSDSPQRIHIPLWHQQRDNAGSQRQLQHRSKKFTVSTRLELHWHTRGALISLSPPIRLPENKRLLGGYTKWRRSCADTNAKGKYRSFTYLKIYLVWEAS